MNEKEYRIMTHAEEAKMMIEQNLDRAKMLLKKREQILPETTIF